MNRQIVSNIEVPDDLMERITRVLRTHDPEKLLLTYLRIKHAEKLTAAAALTDDRQSQRAAGGVQAIREILDDLTR